VAALTEVPSTVAISVGPSSSQAHRRRTSASVDERRAMALRRQSARGSSSRPASTVSFGGSTVVIFSTTRPWRRIDRSAVRRQFRAVT